MAGFNRDAIQELFDYTGYTWREIGRGIREAGEEHFLEPAAGSGWPALRDCLGHIIVGYDRWLGYTKGEPWKDFDPQSVGTLSEMDDAYESFRADFKRLLDGTSDSELTVLREIVAYGEPAQNSTGELLAHTLLHERGHAGDVTTLFYQLKLEPDVFLEYRFHLGRHTLD